MVKNVNECCLEFKFDPFTNTKPFHHAYIQIEVERTIDRVQREVAERARCRCPQQTWFQLGGNESTCSRICDDVQNIRIDEIDTFRSSVKPNVLFKVRKGDSN